MKFKLPDDCAGVSLEGVPLRVAADRTVEADDAAASALGVHGLVPEPDPVAAPAASEAPERRGAKR